LRLAIPRLVEKPFEDLVQHENLRQQRKGETFPRARAQGLTVPDATTVDAGTLYRLAAFSDRSEGGNPAGVWVGDTLPEPAVMQRIAASVGFSETAFVAPASGARRTVRYYSPEAEVSFCGHATIATGVLLGQLEGDGSYALDTAVGTVPVVVRSRDGVREASLTSVEPAHAEASEELLSEVLATLDWCVDELDPSIPPARVYAGAWHLVLATAESGRLSELDYDFERLKAAMLRENLTTLQLVWRERELVFHSRNPFPVGGVVEDPATGAAAAALGGYLRDAALLAAPATILIRQGESMGRPSRLTVDIPARGGVVVTGTAVPI
jgi:PhzF family phenazine biosynthesis protein